ncbi:MAG TPA: VOC family protein [Cyclobacteriaceae bacterium]|jgi:catechol 2,3-dioxygenase-like lactoylglutathione lyase family enzyme
MNITKIKETCLYSDDLEQTKFFYTKYLGLKVINYLEGKHLFLRAGSSVLLFFNPEDSRLKETPPPHFGEGKMHVAFEVSKEDYEKCRLEIENAGIQITHEEIWPGNLRSFYFNDPNGHVLEIVPPGLWEINQK